MKTTELIAALRARGVDVTPRGDHLVVTAPPGVLTADDRQALADHKPLLLRLLRSGQDDPVHGGPRAGNRGRSESAGSAGSPPDDRLRLSPAEVARARDRAASYLRELEAEAGRVREDEDAYAAVLRRFWSALTDYETLAKAAPEPEEATCRRCGRPSPRGLTPCDVCIGRKCADCGARAGQHAYRCDACHACWNATPVPWSAAPDCRRPGPADRRGA